MKLIDFGEAIRAMKEGHKVAREGWNGKGMYILIRKPDNEYYHGMKVLPSLCMKTADNKVVIGWLASQTDILAEDWIVTE